MASYLRPRRGKRATAISQNIILKKGEVFFEVPDGGVGTGAGKIKMGDGTTTYQNLPYFYEPAVVDVASSTIAFEEATSTDNTTLLNAIASGAQTSTLMGNIKKLLRNLNTSVTSLNNDLENKCKILSIDTTNVTIPENSEVGKIFNIASATLNPNSKYLIIGFCASLSNYSDNIMSCGIMVDPLSENSNLFYANGGNTSRTTMSNGGGLHCIRYYETYDEEIKIYLYTNNYISNNDAYQVRGNMLIIQL